VFATGQVDGRHGAAESERVWASSPTLLGSAVVLPFEGDSLCSARRPSFQVTTPSNGRTTAEPRSVGLEGPWAISAAGERLKGRRGEARAYRLRGIVFVLPDVPRSKSQPPASRLAVDTIHLTTSPKHVGLEGPWAISAAGERLKGRRGEARAFSDRSRHRLFDKLKALASPRLPFNRSPAAEIAHGPSSPTLLGSAVVWAISAAGERLKGRRGEARAFSDRSRHRLFDKSSRPSTLKSTRSGSQPKLLLLDLSKSL
jgi:hypothetical protein